MVRHHSSLPDRGCSAVPVPCPRGGGRLSALAAVTMLACVALSTQARAQTSEAPVQFTLQSVVTGLDPATGRDDTTFGVTAHAGAQRVRIELATANRPPATMLLDRASGEGWAFDPAGRSGLPVSSDAALQMTVNPAAPCARMRVTCHPLPARSLAGVEAAGWRYAGAARRGPGGSHAGSMWVDPASGVVLGYEARTRDRKVRRMRALSFQVGPVPDHLLEFPAGARDR